MSNYDELIKFAKQLKAVKDNQQYLEFKPVVGIIDLTLINLQILDGEDKIEKIKPFELKTLNMETSTLQVSNNIDTLIQNYTQTVMILKLLNITLIQ